MAENPLITIVDDCINRLQSGQTVADCLRVYPEYADQIAPLLEAGTIYRRVRVTDAEVALSQERVRFRFEQALSSSPPVRRRGSVRRIFWLLAATLILITLLTATTVAAQSSIPGDSLYHWKRISESVAMILPVDTDFNERRLDELRQLLTITREAAIDFEGTIGLVDEGIILVADIPVEITDETRIDAPLAPDTRVRVAGHTTTDSRFVADWIQPIDRDAIAPEPTATVTLTSTPTRQSSATNTTIPAVTSTRETTRIEASSTPQSRPTATPLPTDTSQPTVTLRALSSATPARSQESTDADGCTPTVPDGWVAYDIEDGDTLSDIAVNSQADVDEVIATNCIDNPGRIVVGTRIYLPQQPVRRESNTTATSEPQRTAIATREVEDASSESRDSRGSESRPTEEPQRERNNDRDNGNAGRDRTPSGR